MKVRKVIIGGSDEGCYCFKPRTTRVNGFWNLNHEKGWFHLRQLCAFHKLLTNAKKEKKTLDSIWDWSRQIRVEEQFESWILTLAHFPFLWQGVASSISTKLCNSLIEPGQLVTITWQLKSLLRTRYYGSRDNGKPIARRPRPRTFDVWWRQRWRSSAVSGYLPLTSPQPMQFHPPSIRDDLGDNGLDFSTNPGRERIVNVTACHSVSFHSTRDPEGR